ncbi:MAG: phosphotransferase enzyme family protein [Bacillota bacterium]
MNTLSSYSDYDGLIKILNSFYSVNIEEIHLHREMIGHVYFARNRQKRFVLKLYRSFNTEQALQSVVIIEYLRKNDYPVVAIVPTEAGTPHIELTALEGQCIGVLFEYIEGSDPNLETEITSIGKQVGELHRLMETYTKPLIRRGKEFYIDRFIRDLRKLEYCPARIRELEQYGTELWASMERMPTSFCHGDLHSGNMLQTEPGQYVLFDFDIASRAYSVIDVATLTDASDFNHLDEAAYDATTATFERFYKGYSQMRTIGEAEIATMFDFIAIRHYELIATITECQGLDDLSQPFLDQQFEWLMKWRTICSRKRS